MRADTRWMVSISGGRSVRRIRGRTSNPLGSVYYPSIDTWNGRDKLQINIQSYF